MLHIISPGGAEPPPSPARAAIVTVVIGEVYEKTWMRLCAGSWRDYAEKFGMDLIVYNTRIDTSDTRSPAWQKLLILDRPWAKRYERIVWMDSDIIVSGHAPNILDYAGPPEKIGICCGASRLSPVEGQIFVERRFGVTLSADTFETAWREKQEEIYTLNNLPTHPTQYNSGVMVVSPEFHNALFLSLYGCPEVTRLYEQPHLSHRIFEDNLAHRLSPRFNWGILESLCLYVEGGFKPGDDDLFVGRVVHMLLCAELRNAYFLHFYGAVHLLHHYATSSAFEPSKRAA